MNPKHLSRLIGTQAKKYGEKIVMYDRNELTDPWTALNWNEMSQKVDVAAKSFLELGVKNQQRVAQFSQNKAENLIIDFALYSLRASLVPIYPTSTAQQVDFIVSDAEIEYMFVGDQNQYDVAAEVLKTSKTLKKLIVFEKEVKFSVPEKSMYYEEFVAIGEKSARDAEVEKLRDELTEKDIACIMYTSGTTGNPKGVIMTHKMFNEGMRIHTIRLKSLNDQDISLAFLPLTHVFERTWCYFLLFSGVTIYINHRPAEIQQTIRDVRPTMMCAVPRFWEKVYIGVQEVLNDYSPLMLGVVTWAIATGKRHNIDRLRIGKKPDIFLSLSYKIADSLVFSKVKTKLGLENAKILPVAGAKLSNDIALFFRSIGVPIVYGYGLTESTATVTCYDEQYQIGAVGSIMPDVQVKTGTENEILLKGKTITPGYYNNPEANKKAFTEDGWFKTGDAGTIENNMIILTERLKDLFKTSNGKYIAPQEIETRLGTDKFIEQVAVIGDERNYVTAIIAPSIPALEAYAKEKNIHYKDTDELLVQPEILNFMTERIAAAQKGMASYEMIKKFTLIKIPFTIEAGELTNTLKIRRAVVQQKYKAQIDAMYK